MKFSPKILLVDDVQMIRRALKTTLLQAGISGVTEAKNGAEAIELLKQERFDLVICDWEMPEVSGIETLRFVRSDDRHRQIPFIMVTSVAEPDRIKQAMREGVTDYIVKPVRPDLFLGKITFILQKLKNHQLNNNEAFEVKEWVIR